MGRPELMNSVQPMAELGFAATVSAVKDSQKRLLAAVSGLSDDEVRAPSSLPGWSRGHVLTHVARSSDAVNRLVNGIVQGESVAMYPGGPDARAAAIEEGAGRPLALIAGDLEFAGSRLIVALEALTESQWGATVAWRRPVTAAFLPELRWRELEIHHLDLNIGYRVNDWPADFVQACLATELPLLEERAPGVVPPKIGDAELLAWLIGRSTDPALPDLPAWL